MNLLVMDMDGPEAVFVFMIRLEKDEAGETGCDFPGPGGVLNR
jgi:hypothetical protein